MKKSILSIVLCFFVFCSFGQKIMLNNGAGVLDSNRLEFNNTTKQWQFYSKNKIAFRISDDSLCAKKTRVGGNINYATIDSANYLRLYGSTKVWKDVAISGFAIPSNSDAPAFTTGYAGSSALGANYYQGTSRDDIAYFTCQMNHDVSEGDSIDFHFHYSPTTLPVSGDSAVFLFTWVGADIAGVMTPVSSVTIKICMYGKLQWQHAVTQFTILTTGTGVNVSKMYVCSLQRLANSNPTDNYAQNIALISLDAHAKIDRIGSNQRFSK